MADTPDDPRIPTLTRVVSPGRVETEAPGTDEPFIPGTGALPRDLDIDLQLGDLDKLPDRDEDPTSALEPIHAPPPHRPSEEDRLRRQVEALVDEALAAHLAALRERLVEDVLRLLSENRREPGADAPGE